VRKYEVNKANVQYVVDAHCEDSVKPGAGARTLTDYFEGDVLKQPACKDWKGVVGKHHIPNTAEIQRMVYVSNLIFGLLRRLTAVQVDGKWAYFPESRSVPVRHSPGCAVGS